MDKIPNPSGKFWYQRNGDGHFLGIELVFYLLSLPLPSTYVLLGIHFTPIYIS